MCPNTFAFRYFRLIRLRHVITPAITITRPTGCAKHEHGETHHVFGTSGPTTISAYPLYGHHLWMWYSPTPIILHSVLRAANRFPQCRIPLRPRTLAITEINPGSEGRLFRAALVFQRYKISATRDVNAHKATAPSVKFGTLHFRRATVGRSRPPSTLAGVASITRHLSRNVGPNGQSDSVAICWRGLSPYGMNWPFGPGLPAGPSLPFGPGFASEAGK